MGAALRRRSLARAGVLASVLVVAPAPGAGSEPPPSCTFTAMISLAPGLSAAPSSGTFESAPDEPGTYRCRAFGSEQSGEAGTEGRYGTTDVDSCVDGGEGTGRLRFGDGDAGSAGDGSDFTFTYSPFSDAGVSTGRFQGDGFAGTFRLTTEDGDCGSDRVTRVRLEGEGTVTP